MAVCLAGVTASCRPSRDLRLGSIDCQQSESVDSAIMDRMTDYAELLMKQQAVRALERLEFVCERSVSHVQIEMQCLNELQAWLRSAAAFHIGAEA